MPAGSELFLIPGLPLLAFLLIAAFGLRPQTERAAPAPIIAALCGSLWLAFRALSRLPSTGRVEVAFPWLHVGAIGLDVGVLLDGLSGVMLVVVSLVSLLVQIYSIGYMKGEIGYGRYFAYMSLFSGSMLALVISNNIVQTYIFWELVGICSYLLIGFWYRRPAAAAAAKKAFVVTRFGDLGFLTAVLALSSYGHGVFGFTDLAHAAQVGAFSKGLITAVSLLLFCGAIGKSAQFPLHIWLPDAMEGPTPVSALIHAATMVAAGVYLIARTYPLYITAAEIGGPAMTAVALVGAFTAIFAATIGVAQDDIKRVLAYSTISQLGFMVAALGIGAYVAGAFHLITHAFFKALLFLSAGSVIHGVGTNDMMNMGGLRKKMPITTTVFIIGAVALAGIPPFAGFWSKDEILAHAFERGFGEHPDQVASAVFVMLAIAAFFTAFYMTRQIFLTFFGEGRDHHAVEHAHESPKVMWIPLAILAFFATVIGLINAPGISFFEQFVGEGGVLGIKEHLEVTAFNPMIAGLSVGIALLGIALGYLVYGLHPVKSGQRDPLSRVPVLWSVFRNKYWMDELYGIVIAQKEGPAGRTGTVDSVRVQPGLLLYFVGWLSDVCFAFDKWVVDGLVNLAGALGRVFSTISGWIDKTFVDGAVNFVGMITNELGDGLKYIQTGRVQNYLLIAITGATVIVFVFFLIR